MTPIRLAVALALCVALFACDKAEENQGNAGEAKNEKVEKGEEPKGGDKAPAEAKEEPAEGDKAPTEAKKEPTEAKPEPAGDKKEPTEAKVEPKPEPIAAKTPKLTERREGMVHAVWFRGPVGPQASGGTSPVTIRVEPNTSGTAAVGVLEEYAGGAGNQWKSSSWVAAFTASQIAGHMLIDHEFMVKTGGHIDGPSAGMLMTATMLALLRGDKVREDSTMSGTVNPDGSAGPVGGLPQKMKGAKEQGKKRFGYPIGNRNAKDLQTGQMVDLHQVAESMGLEAKEIKSVWDAYEFMTGKTLDHPEAASEGDMQLSGDARAKLNAKVQGWKAKIKGELPLFTRKVQELGQLAQGLAPQWEEVKELVQKAERFEDNGILPAAYMHYAQAAVMLNMIRNMLQFLQHASKGDFNAITTQIESLAAVKGKLEAMGMELVVAAKTKTIGGLVNGVRGYTDYVMALSFESLGSNSYRAGMGLIEKMKQGQLQATQEAITAVMQNLALPLAYYAAADALIEVAKEQMSLSGEEGATLQADLTKLGALAKGYGSAASASLAYFDSLWVEQMAEHFGVTKEQASAAMQQQEFQYLLVKESSTIAQLADRLTGGEKPETNLIRLAAGAFAYIAGGSLVNKYYSLGAQPKQDGGFDLTNRRALTFQLDLARQTAREAAGRCKARHKFIPTAAKAAYELGMALREGDDEDKLEALEAYWESTFWSNLAVTI